MFGLGDSAEHSKDCCKLKVTLSLEWHDTAARPRSQTVPAPPHCSVQADFAGGLPQWDAEPPFDEDDDIMETRSEFSEASSIHGMEERTTPEVGKHRRTGSEGETPMMGTMMPPRIPFQRKTPPQIPKGHKRSASCSDQHAALSLGNGAGKWGASSKRSMSTSHPEAVVGRTHAIESFRHSRNASGGDVGSVGHHRRNSSQSSFGEPRASPRGDVDALNEKLAEVVTERDQLQTELDDYKKKYIQSGMILTAQKRLNAQTQEMHMKKFQQLSSGMVVQEKDEEILMLKTQINTLKAFVETETAGPKSRNNRASSGGSLQTNEEEVIEDLEEKITELETTIMVTKVRNASLEEENLKLRNEMRKMKPSAAAANPPSRDTSPDIISQIAARFRRGSI